MKIYPIFSYSNDSNCYIIADKKICIIDTGFRKIMYSKIFDTLEKILEKDEKIQEIFILNTHCHYDHIGNDRRIFDKLCNDFYVNIIISEYDRETIIKRDENKVLNYLFGEKFPEIDEEMVKFVTDGTIINLGETNLEVIHTPGHTYGSISIYEKETGSVFTGDLIFEDAIGRNDFVDSNWELQKNSIEKILELNFKNLFPGHGKILHFENALKVYRMFFGSF